MDAPLDASPGEDADAERQLAAEAQYANAGATPPLHPFVHEAASPPPKVQLPDAGSVVRGLGLGAISVAAFATAVVTVQRLGWLAAPIAGVLGLGGLLAGWAAAIHITGGEKFDDHPWV
ncbi:MAG TPA: hypothetical protein VN697_16215 [Tepidiformaceae bacterium]|nr:hypothetical protein [Tepidiformaceae bacterium]